MRFASPRHFAQSLPGLARGGAVALVFLDDYVDLDGTIAHHLDLGFRFVAVFGPEGSPVPDDPRVHAVAWDAAAEGALESAVNDAIAAAPGTWVYYGHNAEYLFFPFSDSRRIGDVAAFLESERRASARTAVIDLYPGDPACLPDAVPREDTWFDRTGYYALPRPDPAGPVGATLDRQEDLYGGLRWRFEEHVPEDRRRIDRVALFRSEPGLRLMPGHRFNLAEVNTHACPWHRSLTACVASFRAAKALRSNPASRDAIGTFRWSGSERFEWRAAQLMECGLMEPGQWF